MRIDILPHTSPSAQDSGNAGPESNPVTDGGAFLAVMDQMTRPAEIENRMNAEEAARQAGKEEDHVKASTAVPILPFALVSADGPQSVVLSKTHTVSVSQSDLPQATPERYEGDRDRTSDPAPAGPDPAPPAGGDDRKAGINARAVMPGRQASADAVLQDETARTSDFSATESEARADVMPPAVGDTAAADKQNKTATSAPPFPALPENANTDTSGEAVAASELSAGGDAPTAVPLQTDAADSASVSNAVFIATGGAQGKAVSAPPAPGLLALRGNAKETRSGMLRTQAVEQGAPVSTTPQPGTERGGAKSESAVAGISGSEPGQENLGKSNTAVQPDGAEAENEVPAKRMEPAGDLSTPAWADTQLSQRVIIQNLSAPTSSPDAQVFATSRTWPPPSSTSSASLAVEVNLPHQTSGDGLKSILTLLTPKQSPPAADFLAQLAGRIQMQLRDRQNILTIQLRPGSLGRMEIKAETTAAGVLATIYTESASVKNYLEHNLPQLTQSFQDQGLKADRISVEVQEGLWSQQSSPGHQESRSSSNRHDDSGLHSGMSGFAAEPVEELILDQQTMLALRPHSTFYAIA